MIENVLVFGAGSIGNHLTHACRHHGWHVTLCDIDEAALSRTKSTIYPGRYGAWDPAVNAVLSTEVPHNQYDLVVIGTPPASHTALIEESLKYSPKAVLVEKPVSDPSPETLRKLSEASLPENIQFFVGYDHAVSEAAGIISDRLMNPDVGDLLSIDVDFREYWGGIFAAHYWLAGPQDSYLGYWDQGGGCLSEHSHALHLWLTIARWAGRGDVQTLQATLTYEGDGNVLFDNVASINLRTKCGMVGRVVQDVITNPPRKTVDIQCRNARITWKIGAPKGDEIRVAYSSGEVEDQIIQKKRPDDFIRELDHINQCLDQGSNANSPINLSTGIEVMTYITAAHEQNVRERSNLRVYHGI